MKPVSTLFILLLTILRPCFSQSKIPLTEIQQFGTNPGNLKMYVHEPLLKGNKSIPLVVVLHGCGENANTVALLSGWNKLADSNHFMVLYPQQKMGNNFDACFNWFKLQDIERGKGESESIYQMISFVQQHYGIDSGKIFITGFSAGAAMTVVMMSNYPEIFKSGAVFAGAAYKLATNTGDGFKALLGHRNLSTERLVNNILEQNSGYKGRYPSMIIYQGLKDLLVNPANAGLLINQWTGINHTDTVPKKIEQAYLGVKDITRKLYEDITGRTVVIYYEVDHLGHQIMVIPGEKKNECGHTGVFGVNKGFNATYQTAIDFGLIEEIPTK